MAKTVPEAEVDLMGLEIEANRHRYDRYIASLKEKKPKGKLEVREPKRHSEGIMNLLSSSLPMSKGVKEIKLAVERSRETVGTEELTDLINKHRSISQPARKSEKRWRGRMRDEPEFRATQTLRKLMADAEKAEKVLIKEQQPEKQRACACLCLLS